MKVRPKGAGAVMADRARGEVAGDDAQAALWRRLELFPTPPWAARAGGELIRRLDPAARSAHDPACGLGHMAHGLSADFPVVFCSDIHLHSIAWTGAVFDYLSREGEDLDPQADWMVTNPPFATAAEFVRIGLRRARRGVAILARASFLESAGRYPLFFPPEGEGARLTVYAPFCERVPMVLGRWDPAASTATAYAWFVWMRPELVAPELRGITQVIPIAPGTRERLTHPDDARLFGARAAAPLFDHAGGQHD